MKKGLMLFFLSGLVLFGGAQVSFAQSDSSEVVVHSFHWRLKAKGEVLNGTKAADLPDYSSGDLLNPARRPSADPQARRASADPQRLSMPSTSAIDYRSSFDGYESSLQLENVSAKTIVAVEWEHLFFSDDAKRNEVRRFSFGTKTKIGPGEQTFVGAHIRPKKPLKLPSAKRQSVIINRITYADGSVWRRS
jgi:hypothetical protein